MGGGRERWKGSRARALPLVQPHGSDRKKVDGKLGASRKENLQGGQFPLKKEKKKESGSRSARMQTLIPMRSDWGPKSHTSREGPVKRSVSHRGPGEKSFSMYKRGEKSVHKSHISRNQVFRGGMTRLQNRRVKGHTAR